MALTVGDCPTCSSSGFAAVGTPDDAAWRELFPVAPFQKSSSVRPSSSYLAVACLRPNHAKLNTQWSLSEGQAEEAALFVDARATTVPFESPLRASLLGRPSTGRSQPRGRIRTRNLTSRQYTYWAQASVGGSDLSNALLTGQMTPTR